MRSSKLIAAALTALAAAACGGSEPPAQTGTTGAAAADVHVGISRDGTTRFDGERVKAADLTERARRAAQASPNLTVIVDAEREVSFQVVMSAVERLKAGGATSIVFGTLLASPPETGRAPTPPVAAADPPGAPGAGGAEPATGPSPEPHASIPAGTKWDCPFPAFSERGGKSEANVLVRVHVESDGKPVSADVLEDPGAGFAAAAKKCVLAKSYEAAKDVNGQPIRAATFPFYVHFVMK